MLFACYLYCFPSCLYCCNRDACIVAFLTLVFFHFWHSCFLAFVVASIFAYLFACSHTYQLYCIWFASLLAPLIANILCNLLVALLLLLQTFLQFGSWLPWIFSCHDPCDWVTYLFNLLFSCFPAFSLLNFLVCYYPAFLQALPIVTVSVLCTLAIFSWLSGFLLLDCFSVAILTTSVIGFLRT